MASFKNEFQNAALKSMSDVMGGVDRNGLDFLRAGPQDTSFRESIEAPISLVYQNTNRTYNGTDCTVAILYNENIIIVGNLETISYSIHRDKMPVRTLGRTYPKDYVRGQRTIAGSMIFVQFDESPLYKIYEFFNKKLENAHRFSSPLVDEIPPFDMMLIFTNEYGFSSIIRLYGVEISDEGGTYSINDIYSETVMQFIAKDIDPMVSAGKMGDGNQGFYQNMLFTKQMQGKVVDEHYASMLRYAQTLEQNLASIDKQMSAVRRDARFAKPLSTEYRTNFARERNQNRVSARTQFDLLSKRREAVLKEIQDTYNKIRKYEQTSMTWDLNSGTEPNYTRSPAFTDININ